MTTVYFVRHAQPNYSNHDDLSRELTEKGLRDCALVTEFLSDKDITAVLSLISFLLAENCVLSAYSPRSYEESSLEV